MVQSSFFDTALFHYTFVDPLAAYQNPRLYKGITNLKGYVLVHNSAYSIKAQVEEAFEQMDINPDQSKIHCT